jgi:hypothetical protein
MEERKETAKEKLVRRYKEVHKEKTGQELTDEEAYAQAINLVTLVKAVIEKN